jgi:hypothetical protein
VANKETVRSATGKTFLVERQRAARRDAKTDGGHVTLPLALSIWNERIKQTFKVNVLSQFFVSFAPPRGG